MKDSYKNIEISADIKERTGYLHLPVKKIIHYTKDLFELQLDRSGFKFEPGECVSIYLDDGKTFREYSIASGKHDSYLSFLIKHLEHGIVTEYLQNCIPGDILKISQPYGSFRPGRQHGEGYFIFIATGTGIAPFLSYLKSYPQDPPLRMLYGIRRIEESVDIAEIRKICPVEVAVSAQNIEGYHNGRVTDLLSNLPTKQEFHYYLCGLDTMIEEVSNFLINAGLNPGNIHREVFFYTKKE